MDNTTQCTVTVYDHRCNARANSERSVAVESALVIGVNAATDYTIMRTPGHDRELAAGFLLTEGIIDDVHEILMLRQCPETPHAIAVQTSNASAAPASRNLVVNSSCGLCGRADMDALLETLGQAGHGLRVPYSVIYDIPKRVMPAQSLFKAAGATHAAALFDAAGDIFVVREDVGRHNAMDKVIGAALLRGKPTADMGVFLSGRVSLELVVKAARSGISVMVSVSAPTDVAVTMANRLGITLTCFARETGFTVYAHPERIAFAGAAGEAPAAYAYG
ncbi:formate dehydrogenase accessory sulfurtransferase FdhD [Geobacter sp. FeAm09]|uniref:formate dehydrogenase accessory sulfurtransferase FdhD n=1 Tax=Geobacter sp. FeAm09 TaxID=2597769 RepID=UPI0011ECF910|nr:formate dehydrogenase accessory sulfurtransferase FdhD [Geobacter sp. FeAm09]QEM67651.1 formate dehydrogenase accessory sulfurtransferase FdhD [Geobacter sp. FeAm09]